MEGELPSRIAVHRRARRRIDAGRLGHAFLARLAARSQRFQRVRVGVAADRAAVFAAVLAGFRLRRAFVPFPHSPGGARIDSGLTDMQFQRLGVGRPLAIGRDRRPRLPRSGNRSLCPGIRTCVCPWVCT